MSNFGMPLKFLPLFILLFGLHLFGQQKQEDKRPRVGLILSGGGAKGLAHIGALKVIENSGVHIDYIGGSSMGAIVGGLFAAGYSAEQLDSIFKTTNFRTLIQDHLPRRVKTFNERMSSERYALTLPFDHFKLRFPTGFSRGQNVYNLLSQLMYPVRGINDFSKLPTPFFCIGTNIENGDRLVLDHGSLPLAVSASGAIPSLFAPVKIGDKLVSDGGITDNFPVEEMRKHKVDYIIGIDVQDSLAGRKNLQSVVQILTQVNNFRTIKAMKSKRKLVDLYIKPNIKDFSVLSFDKGQSIIRSGEIGALKVKATLDSIAKAQHYPHQHHSVKLKDSVLIKSIKIIGSTNYPRDYIRGKLQVQTKHKTSYQKLNEGLNNLSATDNFRSIHYQLIPEKEGGNQLLLIVEDNPNKIEFRFSLHYDGLYKSGALVNLTRKSLFLKNDKTSLDLIIGDNFRYKFDYYVDKGNYWSIGFRSALNKFDQKIGFSYIADKIPDNNYNVNKIQLNYLDITNQFYLETFFLKAFRFGVGIEHKYTRLKTETILVDTNIGNKTFTLLEKSNLFGPYGYLEYDNYDKAYFPTNGLYFRGDMHFYALRAGSSFNFNPFAVVKGKLGFAFKPLSKLAVRLQAETGFRFGRSQNSALDFFLGGYGNHYVNNIEPFFGYDFLAKSGNSYNKSSVQLDYLILPKNHLMFGYNIANIGDDLYKNGEIFEGPDYTGFSLGYGLESFLGPLEVFYSFSPETRRSHWFFSLGFWF